MQDQTPEEQWTADRRMADRDTAHASVQSHTASKTVAHTKFHPAVAEWTTLGNVVGGGGRGATNDEDLR